MNSKMKLFGPALLAAFAIAAVTAGAAAAQPFEIFSENPSATIITGSDDTVDLDWKFDTGEFHCENETDEGSVEGEGESTDLSVAPAFSECSGFGLKGTVDANGCKFVYQPGNIEGGNFEGSVDISCPGTKSIEITSLNCIVTVPSQKGLKKVTYTNKGVDENRDITVEFNVTGLTYTEDKKGVTPCKGGTKNNGTLTGNRTVIGEDKNKNRIGIWVQ